MSTSTIGTVLDALVDALSARPALQGVAIYSASIGPDRPEECIELASGAVTWSEVPMGLSEAERLEDYDLSGVVFVAAPENDEDAIRSARDRALEIVADVETYINANDTIGATCLDAQLKRGGLTQAPYAGSFNGRCAEVTFTIAVRASKEP